MGLLRAGTTSRCKIARAAMVASLAGLLVLSACGGPKSSTTLEPTGKSPASAGQNAGGNTSGSNSGAPAANNGQIDVAIGYNNNSSWDPLNTGSAFSMAAHNHIYEGLWDAKPVSRQPFAALAAAMPSDADLKATEWTVPLRKGATWHDGKPVTADDVVYTFGRILNTQKPIITTAFFSSWLNSVTKVDDATVKISMKFAFPSAVQRFSIAKIMPKHVFDGKEDDYFKSGKNAIGSGPYKIAGHEDTSFTKFEKFAAYNGSLKPAADSMQWNVSVDAAARVGLLTAGVSGVQISDNIPQDTIEALKAKGLQVEGVDSMNMLGLAFNTSKKPFDDKRVRQALRMAIDTKKLIDVAIAGQGSPATAFLQETSPEYNKAATQYQYDPEKAKKLLAEAGVTKLDVRLMTSNISWTMVAVNTIKEGWDAVGVNTTIDSKETAQFNTALAEGDNADAVTFSGNPNQFGTDADLNIRWFYSGSTQFLPWNKWNASPEYKALDEKLNAAQQINDPAEHKKAMNAILDTIAAEGVVYPVMHMKLFTAWDPKALDGVTPLDIPGVNLLGAARK